MCRRPCDAACQAVSRLRAHGSIRPQVQPHLLQELVEPERLDQVAVGAGGDRVALDGFAGHGGDHEDRDARGRFARLELAADLDAVGVGEHDVEDDEVDVVVDGRERVGAAR